MELEKQQLLSQLCIYCHPSLEVTFEGKNLKKLNHILLIFRIGYVPQEEGFSDIMIKENLEISLVNKNGKNIDEVLEDFLG